MSDKQVRRGRVLALLERGKIETTLAQAKSVRDLVDKVINLSKKNTVAARRELRKILGKDIEVASKFKDRNSGYSRIIRLGKRFSDTTERVILELIHDDKTS